MEAPTDWSIIFYQDVSGRTPVAEFLESLDSQTQVRISYALEQLRIRNILAREPLARHLGGKLWELRETSNRNAYRIIYFFFTGRQIVLVHGFQKKTQRTPRTDIEIAETRMASFITRA